MRHKFKTAFVGAALLATLPAQASTFDYVQVSFVESDAFKLSLKGPQLDLSKTLGERYFVAAGYGDFNADVRGFDVDSELVYIRGGIKVIPAQKPSLTMYGGIEALRVEYSYMAMGEDDTGFGGFFGLRNMVTDDLEFKAEFKLNKVFDDTNFSGEFGLRYFLTSQFSVTAIGTMGSVEGYQIGAAYHF
ncbi:hypothetical protein ACR0ST_12255 [Aliidiomarina sp. Khilg15.8]